MKETFTKSDILEALERKEFVVHYQPIVDKENSRIVSGEALVRWQHPRHGLLHPNSFIGIAEKTGAIRELGEYVLREACLRSKKWRDEGYPFYRVTVNISLAQLEDKQFPTKVRRIIEDTQADPDHITFEITESMAMADPDHTRSTLVALKAIGVRIALDDFGAGYSSLAHLRHFPVDALKIDGQFIKQSLYSERDCKLMQSIILLAKALDLHVVAEGVETEEQLHLLRKLDCTFVQGFYFTHALPHEEYREWCHLYSSDPRVRM